MDLPSQMTLTERLGDLAERLEQPADLKMLWSERQEAAVLLRAAQARLGSGDRKLTPALTALGSATHLLRAQLAGLNVVFCATCTDYRLEDDK